MPTPAKLPLALFQVLEQEFQALHAPQNGDAGGAQPQDTFVVLADDDTDEPRRVKETLNWEFDATQIKDPAGLSTELDLGLVEEPAQKFSRSLSYYLHQFSTSYSHDPEKLAKQNLKHYLRTHVSPESRALYRDGIPGVGVLVATLNSFLDDENLFNENRFSSYWLSAPTRALKDTHTSRFGEGPLIGDDLRHLNRLLLEDAFSKYLERIHRIRLAAVYKRIHEQKPVALCLSGGGIRSGTFALGLLQGLARHKLLDKFHYLSTVSGGGYIGGWLAAWIHRHRDGLTGVTTDLANTTPRTKIDPDPDPIRYLRRYSNFLTPKVGLLSADTWTFVAIYLRNLLLNWFIFIPAILSVLLLPRLIVSLTNNRIIFKPLSDAILRLAAWSPLSFARDFAGFVAARLPVLDDFMRPVFLIAGFLCAIWALAYIMFNRPTVREELRQVSPFWRRRTLQQGFLRWCLLPLSLSAFFLTTYWVWSKRLPGWGPVWWQLALFGAGTTFFGWLCSSAVLRRIHLFSRESLVLLVVGAAGGLVLRGMTEVVARLDVMGLPWKDELYACLAAPVFLLVFLLGVTLYIGFTSKARALDVDDEDREWWARLGAWVFIVVIGWGVFTALVIFGPVVLLMAPRWIASLGGLAGIVAALAGRSEVTPASGRSGTQPDAAKTGIMSLIISNGLPVLAMIFIAVLLIGFSLATTGLFKLVTPIAGVTGKSALERAQSAHLHVIHSSSFWYVAIFLGILFGVSWLFSRWINLNIFSLHAGYRNRLIRAFLGASRPDHQRKPNPFTGFDPADNVAMHELRPGLFNETDFRDAVGLARTLLHPNLDQATQQVAQYLFDNFLDNAKHISNPDTFSLKLLAALRKDLNAALQDPQLHRRFRPGANIPANPIIDIRLNRQLLHDTFPAFIEEPSGDGPYRLMPVINTTLNLVGGENLAWQQRKAEPFSVSPLHSGCFRLGYRDSTYYGGQSTGGISVGTAATISGAAASSNMGYYTSSPVLSLVLTFFNVRLGWWLGNPGAAGNETFGQQAPTYSVMPVLDEALGLTDDKNPYVYLTDGGHFENLGLYEMVLRRCHVIIVSDAAADNDYRFGDLGNAIRKVRIDLGVPIEFTAMPIFRTVPEGQRGMYWAAGRIRYSCIDGDVKDGLLLYVKPAIYGNEPQDVLEYKRSHPTFPHQTTADQFFDEPQFESYRILGSHIMDQLCGSDNGLLSIDQAVDRGVRELITAQADPELNQWWQQWRTAGLLPPAPPDQN